MKQDKFLERIQDPRMEYYRELYKNSPMWDGTQIIGQKKVIVYCEQGLGDIIQAARYFHPLRMFGCKLILHAQEEFESFFLTQKYVDGFIAKGAEELPEHDYHVLSLSLPFLLHDRTVRNPYFVFNEKNEDIEKEFGDYFKIGISWEGKSRKCPLKHFMPLAKRPNTKLFMAQKYIDDKLLLEDCNDLDLMGTEINDIKDTAKLINTMDAIVTVDTFALHMGGALNKPTFGLLDEDCDPRWKPEILYPSVKLLKSNDQKAAIKTVLKYL